MIDIGHSENWRRGSAVGIATGYGLGVGLRVPLGSTLSRLLMLQTGSGVHPVLYPMGTGGLCPRGLSGRGVKLTTQLHLVRSSRTRGSIHPLPHTPSRRSA
jgi:hypothetical protein